MSEVLSNSYRVFVLDLGTARSDVALVVFGHKLVVFRNTGNFDIKFSSVDNDPISITPLAYPQQIVFDQFEFSEVYITNAAQAGQSCTIIVFFRKEDKK